MSCPPSLSGPPTYKSIYIHQIYSPSLLLRPALPLLLPLLLEVLVVGRVRVGVRVPIRGLGLVPAFWKTQNAAIGASRLGYTDNLTHEKYILDHIQNAKNKVSFTPYNILWVCKYNRILRYT